MIVFFTYNANVTQGNVFCAKVFVHVSIHWCKSGRVLHNSSFTWIEMLEVRKIQGCESKVFVVL